MEYATITRAQHTWGVRVPLGQGSYTVHYKQEVEALEQVRELNAAFKAGWEACLKTVAKEVRDGLQNSGYPV